MNNQITNNENFWKNRNIMITNNEKGKEYPIEKDTVINDKRSNAIYILSSSVQFEVLVNDVLLYNFKGEASKNQGGATGMHEINPLLLTSGTHEIKVRIYPAYGEKLLSGGGSVGLIFQYFPFNNIKNITYNSSANGSSGILLDQEKEYWKDEEGEYGQANYVKAHYEPKLPLNFSGLPFYEWRSTFKADVPFNLAGWRNSTNLKEENENSDKISAELYNEYENLYNIIRDKQIDKFVSLIEDREELIAKTLYYGSAEKSLRTDEFIKLIKNDDYELQPLYRESFYLDYQGYGKLVTFLNKADKEGVIRFKSKKNPDENIYLDFLFQRKKKGDKLTVI